MLGENPAELAAQRRRHSGTMERKGARPARCWTGPRRVLLDAVEQRPAAPLAALHAVLARMPGLLLALASLLDGAVATRQGGLTRLAGEAEADARPVVADAARRAIGIGGAGATRCRLVHVPLMHCSAASQALPAQQICAIPPHGWQVPGSPAQVRFGPQASLLQQISPRRHTARRRIRPGTPGLRHRYSRAADLPGVAAGAAGRCPPWHVSPPWQGSPDCAAYLVPRRRTRA